jgi:hypothetical protein
MKKKLKRKKTLFPSSFHISNEGEKPTSTPSPLPLNSKKKRKKNQGAPPPPKQ